MVDLFPNSFAYGIAQSIWVDSCLFGSAVDEYDVAVVVVALFGKLSSKLCELVMKVVGLRTRPVPCSSVDVMLNAHMFALT